MQLKKFSVKGFKNFQTELTLENMGAIVVIHGENNVGKSNLLESMQLFFQLLLVQKFEQSTPITWIKKVPFSELEEQGFYPGDLFNLEIPAPIEIKVTFTIQPRRIRTSQIFNHRFLHRKYTWLSN
jgi:AAA15 family ATPase/GTPase